MNPEITTGAQSLQEFFGTDLQFKRSRKRHRWTENYTAAVMSFIVCQLVVGGLPDNQWIPCDVLSLTSQGIVNRKTGRVLMIRIQPLIIKHPDIKVLHKWTKRCRPWPIAFQCEWTYDSVKARKTPTDRRSLHLYITAPVGEFTVLRTRCLSITQTFLWASFFGPLARNCRRTLLTQLTDRF